MTGARVPLSVLDLVPLISGSTASDALRNTIDLARQSEAAGYRRYWFAEHHLNPGVAGSSPAVMIALVAGATSTIRLGSGGVQSGHRTALSVVEEFGLIDALHPGRLDLGIGRSGGRNFFADRLARLAAAEGPPPPPESPTAPTPAPGAAGHRAPDYGAAANASLAGGHYTDHGLLIPARPSMKHLAGSPRLHLTHELLQQPEAQSPAYSDLLHDIVGLLDGSYRSAEGLDPSPAPGRGANVEVWVLGSSAGESANAAGALGLRFAANYHVSPSTILEAVGAYRAAFVPSATLDRPYVAVSADVVVADDDDTARHLATGFVPWVYSIRSGRGAIAFPSPEEAAAHSLTESEAALVADRVETQFVGSPATVAAHLERLQEATGADELVVTTITHGHADRVRSYQLLADEWYGRTSSSSLISGPGLNLTH